jgi:hypothetical protein
VNLDLAGYGIDVDLHDSDLILDAVVLLRVQSDDGSAPAMVIATTPGLDWMLQIGMIEAARDIMRDADREE